MNDMTGSNGDDTNASQSIPVAVWAGECKLGPLTLRCAVLDDGRRVIEQDSLFEFCRWLEGNPEVSEVERFAKDYEAWARGAATPTRSDER